MDNNNQCQCYDAKWLDWENQMEPGHWCSYCQTKEYEYLQSLKAKEPKLSERMIRLINEAEAKLANADDLPF